MVAVTGAWSSIRPAAMRPQPVPPAQTESQVQDDASLRDEMKSRQQQEASALEAQHRLQLQSAKKQHLTKAQRKQMRNEMKQENRQMRQAHKNQWRNLKAQERWNKQHQKEQPALPKS